MKVSASLAAAFFLASGPAAPGEELMKVREGRWEYAVTIDMSRAFPGLNLPRRPPATKIVCITPELARRHGPMPDPAKEPCKVSGFRASRTTMSYTLECEDKTVDSETTVHSDKSFTTWSRTRTCRNPADMVDIEMKGRWIGGVCTAEELARASADASRERADEPATATRKRADR